MGFWRKGRKNVYVGEGGTEYVLPEQWFLHLFLDKNLFEFPPHPRKKNFAHLSVSAS